MADFANAALPWVAMGFAIAVVFTYMSSKKEKQDGKEQ